MEKFNYEEMEMPTPCIHCGGMFDLNDGYGSEKWHPGITICKDCYYKEEKEIEEDERWDGINLEVCNALWVLDNEDQLSNKLSDENKESILKLAEKLKS